MTQEKMRKLITAIVAAATALFVVLLSCLIYQWITISVYNKKIKKYNDEIAQLEQQIDDKSSELEYKNTEVFKEIAAFKLGLIQGLK